MLGFGFLVNLCSIAFIVWFVGWGTELHWLIAVPLAVGIAIVGALVVGYVRGALRNSAND